MNKIFRVIWSEARNCYVVASELARRHTKGTGGKRTRQAVLAAVLGGALLLPVSSAWAVRQGVDAEDGSGYWPRVERYTDLEGNLRSEKSGSWIDGDMYGNVALGNYSVAGSVKPTDEVVTFQSLYEYEVNPNGGLRDEANGYTRGLYWDSSLGRYVYGKEVKTSTLLLTSLGDMYEVSAPPANPGDPYRVYKLDNDGNRIGSEIDYTPPSRPRTLATNATAVGNAAQALADSSTAVGERAKAQGYKSIAMGSEAQTGDLSDDVDYNDGISAAAFGDSAKAIANNSVAVGDHAQSYGYAGVAMGRQAHADTTNSVAIGNGATVDYDGAAASDETKLVAENGVAIGWNSVVRGKDGTATGRQAEANRRNASAYGNNSHANGYNSVAVGNKSIAGLRVETGRDPIAGQSATAMGNRATAIAEYTTALGASTWAEGWHSVAVGDSNRATGRFSTAMGAGWSTYEVPGEDDNTNTEGARSYSAIGANQASGDYSTSVGYGNATLGDNSSAFGMQNAVSGTNSLGIGSKNIIGTVRQPGATDLTGTDKGDISGFAFGNANEITGNEGLALGESNTVSGENGIAAGVGSEATAKNTMAAGTEAKATGDNAIGIGAGAEGSATDAVAMGHAAKAGAEGAVSLGAGAQVEHAHSVALGENSVTDAVVATSVIEIPGTGKQWNVAGTNPIGTVSIGAAPKGTGNPVAGRADAEPAPRLERTITNVAAGRVSADSTDAINGSELYAVMQAITQGDIGGTTVQAGNNIKVDADKNEDTGNTTYTIHGLKTEVISSDQSIDVDEQENKNTGVTVYDLKAKPRLYAGDDGQTDATKVIQKKGGERLDIIGGADKDKLTDKNIGVNNANGQLMIQLVKDVNLSPEGSLTTGDTVINNSGMTIQNGPKVTKNDVNMAGNQIHNVAPGTSDTDAVNVSQLRGGLTQNYNALSNRIDKVGAGAAAMAMLHPLDFNPDEKWSFAASAGHYKSENAVAIGAFYRPNEDTMFSLGGSVGNGDNMVAASVSWKFGQKNHVSVNRVSTAKEILELRKALEDMRSLIADGVAGKGLDLSKIEVFPDVPDNHWAYDYVATLAGNGILEGYPDGYFKGGRLMTRYEMAAVIYRAMMNGAKIKEKALKEFAPELDRFRVDTITYHKDGTPHVQRVRTIETRK